MCGKGLMETDSQPAVANAQGTEEPCPLTLSPGRMEEASAGVEYAEISETTKENSVSETGPQNEVHDDVPQDGTRRSGRARHYKGYYKRLAEGTLE